ncbi:MAG: transposase [Gammaproteobacteria bacterium]|nr:transposase [Gammaproteobacteria bacterium]
MPRRGRLAIAGVAWHIIQRGNNRAACFLAPQDYSYYLAQLHEQADRWQCAIHAYALMTNHVHLLLTPACAEGPSQMMRHLGQRYVQHFNRVHGRTGTLWEGRFRSCLAQSEGYVLACYRYIELNPVRAGMVFTPDEYPWSSHHANALGRWDPRIEPHTEYVSLAASQEERCARYRALCAERLDARTVDRIRQATNGNFALGNRRFEAEIAATLGRRVTVGRPGRVARRRDPNRGQTTVSAKPWSVPD